MAGTGGEFRQIHRNYDSFECAEPWARKTLKEHARDRREPLYSLEQLERPRRTTNCGTPRRMQMVKFGWMHNYMRMYWAKKSWSGAPARPRRSTLRTLNDQYYLDGRDPNGYAGIAWAIVGKLDRPWFDRPIFGTIRYMSGASTGKKFNSRKYIQQMSEDFTQAPLRARNRAGGPGVLFSMLASDHPSPRSPTPAGKLSRKHIREPHGKLSDYGNRGLYRIVSGEGPGRTRG